MDDYGQFLMDCVDEFVDDMMAYRNPHSIGYDDFCDWWASNHDEMVDSIFCYFYVDHIQQKCSNLACQMDRDLEEGRLLDGMRE